jgi:threonine/homoserine/homoserine lactone efflux protein
MENFALLPLMTFAFVTSVTPGPNNMMLLASGANFGFRRSVPHMLGIATGMAAMIFIMGLGLAAVIQRFDWVYTTLKVAAALYVGWLAWKIAHAAAPSGSMGHARPIGLWQAAAFQWVNPKAVAMAISAASIYGAGGGAGQLALVALCFVSVGLPSISLWVIAGEALRQWLQSPAQLRAFNWTMAALLIGAMVPVFWA